MPSRSPSGPPYGTPNSTGVTDYWILGWEPDLPTATGRTCSPYLVSVITCLFCYSYFQITHSHVLPDSVGSLNVSGLEFPFD